MKLIYTAMSKHLFYFRHHVSKFVIDTGNVPLNPFMIFDYFLLDTVDRDLVRNGNNTIVSRCDEVWIFGPISDGVLAEIKLAKQLEKRIRYFAVAKSKIITEIDESSVQYETSAKTF